MSRGTNGIGNLGLNKELEETFKDFFDFTPGEGAKSLEGGLGLVVEGDEDETEAVAENKRKTPPSPKERGYEYPTHNGRRVITKMTEFAWKLLEARLMNPDLSYAKLAEMLSSSEAYVARVINSPCFDEEFKAIKRMRIHDKMNNVLMTGIDRMDKILASEASSDAVAVQAFKVVAGAAGMGEGRGGGGITVNNNVAAPDLGVTAEMINEANERRRGRLFQGSCEEVSDE